MDELIDKFLRTSSLTAKECAYLRRELTKARIEHLATRPESRGKLAKALFKLSSYLYASPSIANEKRSALPISTATSMGRRSVDKFSGQILSGGGANGTGKAR